MDNTITPDNVYVTFRQDRLSEGGGICIIARKNQCIKYSEVYIPARYNELEILAVDIVQENKNILRLIAFYFPPHLHSDSDYDSLLSDCIAY